MCNRQKESAVARRLQRRVRQSTVQISKGTLFVETALLVLLSASTGARFISANFLVFRPLLSFELFQHGLQSFL